MEIMALQRTWHRLFAETDAAHDEPLTEAEFLVLAVIGKRGSVSASALDADVGLDRSHVSRIVDRLVGDGLLEGTADPVDEWAMLLTLTGRGQRAVAERRAFMAGRLDVIAGGWPSGDAARFAEGVHRIVTELDDSTGDAEPTELTVAERNAFVSALQIADTLRDRVSRDVYPSTGLSIPDFVVLARLREHPGHSYSGLKAFAAKLAWSPSRLSHQLGRMERRDLITRVPDVESGQVRISMTADAIEVFEKAVALHAASVRRHFFAHVSADQVATLVAMSESIVRGSATGVPVEEITRPSVGPQHDLPDELAIVPD